MEHNRNTQSETLSLGLSPQQLREGEDLRKKSTRDVSSPAFAAAFDIAISRTPAIMLPVPPPPAAGDPAAGAALGGAGGGGLLGGPSMI